mmetsp:Transcript_32305/g.62110  ORF Transcript_32305/g.62110 Transcript_32305/m.62110 type:complete len:427 (-) Transcript_32305:579-1859(-)|eukprot:CAMPEP_0114246768 /NCGR_PEP_ID=MMETSP0058-20121206/12655_1 /TAXON_ID=36894 /ORGANISM="Pyramimonas parkeae, CCMP726" /LENGTH=426 /DNA_ID=CAMNT_0001360009 /DNA_START=554 /DNA_END=1834 /DNA_ORIENTATION=+
MPAALRQVTDHEAIVSRILKAQKTGDHIAVLGLAPPRLENGTVVWDAAESDIARCFRQMSLQVHPDKNKSINAAVAFRALSQAQEALHDQRKRSDCVSKYKTQLVEEARKRTLELRRAWSQQRKASQCREDFNSYQERVMRETCVPVVVTSHVPRPSTPRSARATPSAPPPPPPPPPPRAQPAPAAPPRKEPGSTRTTGASPKPSAGERFRSARPAGERRVPHYMQPTSGKTARAPIEKTRSSLGRYSKESRTAAGARPSSADIRGRQPGAHASSCANTNGGTTDPVEPADARREYRPTREPSATGTASPHVRPPDATGCSESHGNGGAEKQQHKEKDPDPGAPPKTTPKVDKVVKEWLDKKARLEATRREKLRRKVEKDREWLQDMRDQARERARKQAEDASNLYGRNTNGCAQHNNAAKSDESS